jgi:nucleoside-diphosphate-sugar epimerase
LQIQDKDVLMAASKSVLVVGGTGFLGYHVIQELLANGWEVTALGLPPAPPPDLYPASVRVVLMDLERAADPALLRLLRGHQALVFAAGLDDRYTPRKPAYPAFRRANVELPERLFRLARQAGIRRAAVLGSYFAHFDRRWPHLHLAQRHPYIRSRVGQEAALTAIPGLEVCVLELPYIFGSLPIPGWKPLWTPLVRYLRFSRLIFYMKGGTACISARTAGRAIAAAIERGEAGERYPIGQENLTWAEMLERLARADGRRVRVVALPVWLVRLGLMGLWLRHELQGKEAGLDPRHFAQVQTAETFLDARASQSALGFESADLDEAFAATVRAC